VTLPARLALLIVGCACTTPAAAAPLGSIRHVVGAQVIETLMRIEKGRLHGRIVGATADAWVLEVDAQGARFVDPNALDGARCEMDFHASVELRDGDGDGRIDARGDESARVYAIVAWQGSSAADAAAGAAVLAVDIGPGTARLLWLRGTATWSALGLPAAAPAVVRPGTSPQTLLLLGAGWPRDGAADAARTRGELLALDTDTGAALPSPFATDASLISGITPVDVDSDGITDRLYLADARFRLWRLEPTRDGASPLRLAGRVLANFSLGADARTALQQAPDVALAGGSARLWFDVTVGTSDRAGEFATQHWLATVRDAHGADAPGAEEPPRVLPLAGPLAGRPLTVAGHLLIATRPGPRGACDSSAVTIVLTVLSPVAVLAGPDAPGESPGRERRDLTLLMAPGELTVRWPPDPDGDAPVPQCSFGDETLPLCPAGPGLHRDYWLREDAP
jgi:hypothetical protein